MFRWRVDRVLYAETVFPHKGVPLYQFHDKGKIYTLLRYPCNYNYKDFCFFDPTPKDPKG